MTHRTSLKGLMALVCSLALACAADAASTSPTAETSKPTTTVSVAVLEFDTRGEGIENDGEQIQILVTAHLSADPTFRLVERKEIKKILDEQKISLSGLVDEKEAIQIGRLVGAKVIVLGRGFFVDGLYVVVAKIIGTETGRVFGEIVQGQKNEGLPKLVSALAEKIGTAIKKNRNALVAPAAREEGRIARIVKALGALSRPGVLVSCAERHVGPTVIDPAAETEFVHILLACGFKVVEKKHWESGPWLEAYLKDPKAPIPNVVKDPIDVLIVGEAFSEFGARTGDLVSCRACVEVKAIDRRTGEVLAIDRETATAVDLAESIAAKKALQDAAARLAERVILQVTKKWNETRKSSEK